VLIDADLFEEWFAWFDAEFPPLYVETIVAQERVKDVDT